jgi:hypothetical protein
MGFGSVATRAVSVGFKGEARVVGSSMSDEYDA